MKEHCLRLSSFLKDYLEKKEQHISTNKGKLKQLEKYEKEIKIVEDEILNKNRILRELDLEWVNFNNKSQTQNLDFVKSMESLNEEKEVLILKIKNDEKELEEKKRNNQDLDFFQKFEKEEEISRKEEKLIKNKILLNEISEKIEKRKREVSEIEKNSKIVDENFENNINLEREKYKKKLEELVKIKIDLDKKVEDINFKDFYFDKSKFRIMIDLENKLVNYLVNPYNNDFKLAGDLEKFKKMYINTFFEIEEVKKIIKEKRVKLVYSIEELKKEKDIEELRNSINGIELNNSKNIFRIKEKIIYLENKLKKDEIKNSYFSNRIENLRIMLEKFFTTFLAKEQLKEIVKKEVNKCVEANLDKDLYELYQSLLKENV